MTAPELTLKQARETANIKVSRASDFLTNEEVEQLRKSNLKGKKQNSFNKVDAYIAEIIARFGYDTYIAWKNGEIDEIQMVKYIEAERVREVQNRLAIESIIVSSVAGANNGDKHGHAPKSLKTAFRILKNEHQFAGGK